MFRRELVYENPEGTFLKRLRLRAGERGIFCLPLVWIKLWWKLLCWADVIRSGHALTTPEEIKLPRLNKPHPKLFFFYDSKMLQGFNSARVQQIVFTTALKLHPNISLYFWTTVIRFSAHFVHSAPVGQTRQLKKRCTLNHLHRLDLNVLLQMYWQSLSILQKCTWN